MTRLTEISLTYPRSVLTALVMVTVLFAAGLPRLETDVGYRAFLGEEDKEVRKLDDFVARFGGGFPIALIWSCADTSFCSDVFEPKALRMAQDLSRTLELMPGVARVESPATSILLTPSSDGFDVRYLVENGEVASDVSELSTRAKIDPLWVGGLISADGQVGAVVVELASTDMRANQEIFDAAQSATTKYKEQGVEFHFVGEVVEATVTQRELGLDTATLIPAMVGLIAVIIFALFRSSLVVVYSLLVVGGALVWGFGLMGWLAWPQTPISNTLAPLVLVIGICDAIHFLSRYVALNDDPSAYENVLVQVSREVGAPCLLTSVTTAVGLLSFATTGLESIVHFGVIAAVGVLSALILTFTLLPLLIKMVPPKTLENGISSHAWEDVLNQLMKTSSRRAPIIVLTSLILAGISIVGLGRLRVDVDFEQMYGEESEVVQWWRFAENLRKPETLEISIRLPEHFDLESHEVLDEIDRFSKFVSGVPGLGPAHSFLEPFGWTRRLLHDDDPAFNRPAPTVEGNAELMLLLSLQQASALSNWVTLDQKNVRISVEADAISKKERSIVENEIESYIEEEFPEDWVVEFTGSFVLDLYLNNLLQQTQIRSFATAAIAVFVIVSLFLRSIKLGSLAMIPTLLPVVAVMGLMGFADIPLDVANAMIAAVVIGIVVDDAIHLLHVYHSKKHEGIAPIEAIGLAVRAVGRPIVTTSTALICGFLTLTVSTWQSLVSFGLLTALAIGFALVADLVLLPAIIFLLNGSSSARKGVS